MFAGPLGTMIMFLFFVLVTHVSYKYNNCFPKSFAKFVVWFGFGAIADPFMIAVIDIASQNNAGDIYKIYNYYLKADGSGIAGIFVVLIIYAAIFIFNLLIFYNYIVFLHMNGRLQDIYVRLTGDPKAFFIPGDNEMSLKHLLWVYHTAINNMYRIIVNYVDFHNNMGKKHNFLFLNISIFGEKGSSLLHYRTFIRDEKAVIREINEHEISELNSNR